MKPDAPLELLRHARARYSQGELATILGVDFPLPGEGPIGRRGELEGAIIGTVVGSWPIDAHPGTFDRATARSAERGMTAMRRGVSAVLRASRPEVASSVATVGRELLDFYALEAGERLGLNQPPPSPRRFAASLLLQGRTDARHEFSQNAVDSLEHLREFFTQSSQEASGPDRQDNRRSLSAPSLGL